jgi:hypothetical protein
MDRSAAETLDGRGAAALSLVGEMGAGQPGDGDQRKRIEDTQRYVRRLVGYVVGQRRE